MGRATVRQERMARRKRGKKKSQSSVRGSGRPASLDPGRPHRALRIGLGIVAVGAIASGIAWGLDKLDRQVHAQPRFAGPPELVLPDVPEGLEPVIRQELGALASARWSDPQLCLRIGRQLEKNAWVRSVESVRRLPTGRIEARCVYREPVALVQTGGEFVLIDEDCVRLPGRYPYRPSWVLIQGVSSVPPPAGQTWTPPDLAAAVAVLNRLADEAFADQVTAVRVHNYRGRIDARGAQIELATDRAGGRVVWGSAPGEEVEENSAEQKLAILRRNHELYGRIDAGRQVIDVTTFPDRFTTPIEAASGSRLAGGRNAA